MLRLQGQVLEEGQGPGPSLPVFIHAWPAADSGGTDTLTVPTDPAGLFTAALGPFAGGRVDSLLIRVRQSDCSRDIWTNITERDLTLREADTLALPSLNLTHRLSLAYVGNQAAMCAAIVVPNSAQSIGNFSMLNVWIDSLTDSVRGRWRVTHSASVADDWGYLSGYELPTGIVVELRSLNASPCTGMLLDMPLEDPNGSNFDASTLTGHGTCILPDTTIRFFNGATRPSIVSPPR